VYWAYMSIFRRRATQSSAKRAIYGWTLAHNGKGGKEHIPDLRKRKGQTVNAPNEKPLFVQINRGLLERRGIFPALVRLPFPLPLW